MIKNNPQYYDAHWKPFIVSEQEIKDVVGVISDSIKELQ